MDAVTVPKGAFQTWLISLACAFALAIALPAAALADGGESGDGDNAVPVKTEGSGAPETPDAPAQPESPQEADGQELAGSAEPEPSSDAPVDSEPVQASDDSDGGQAAIEPADGTDADPADDPSGEPDAEQIDGLANELAAEQGEDAKGGEESLPADEPQGETAGAESLPADEPQGETAGAESAPSSAKAGLAPAAGTVAAPAASAAQTSVTPVKTQAAANKGAAKKARTAKTAVTKLKEGIYAIFTALKGKRSLSPRSASLKAGTRAALSAYSGNLCEKWQLKGVAGLNGVVTLEDIATGLRLTATSTKYVKLVKAADSDLQRWRVTQVKGKFVFQNLATGKVLQPSHGKTAAKTYIVCAKKTSDKKQRWTLKRVVPVSTGVYELDLSANRKLALEVPGASTKENASVKIGGDDNSAGQRWYYDAAAKTLTSASSGKVLTLKGGSTAVGTKAVQADDKGVATQQWTFTYLGKGCFKVVSAADSSIALNAMGTEAGYRVRAAQKADSPQQSWRMVQAKSNPVTYISLGFSLSQMASWQKAGNPYINGYTTGYLKTVLNPKNGSAYKFLDLRKLTGSSASELNTFISSYGSDGKLAGLGSAFTAAAKKYQVNEVYLLSHAILESGWGKSTLAMGYKYKGGKIDGKYYKKGTYYNFYGIGAYDSSPLSGGRKMAIINGWNTPKKAVAGAAKWITEHYIYADEYAQPTLYAMKWDLARTKAEKGYGWHQYATDPDWADSIGRLIGDAFKVTKPSTVLSYIKPKYK